MWSEFNLPSPSGFLTNLYSNSCLNLFSLLPLSTAQYVDINVVLMVDFPIIKQLNTPHFQFPMSQLNTNEFITNSWMVSSALTVFSISNAYCNQLSAQPCTEDGTFLNKSDPRMPPLTPVDPSENPWGLGSLPLCATSILKVRDSGRSGPLACHGHQTQLGAPHSGRCPVV